MTLAPSWRFVIRSRSTCLVDPRNEARAADPTNARAAREHVEEQIGVGRKEPHAPERRVQVEARGRMLTRNGPLDDRSAVLTPPTRRALDDRRRTSGVLSF
jgi:hypothetical protein